jgi:hypothetical protein
MDQQLVDQPIGPETKLKVELKDKKLVLSVAYDGAGVDGEISIKVGPDYFLDKLAALIPGKIDDAVIQMLKAAFLA